MGIKLSEAIANGLISGALVDIIPKNCEICGEPLTVTETVRQLYCDNRACYGKIAARLESMAKMMNVDGWGMSTCLAVVKRFKLISPVQVFLLGDKEFDEVPAFKKKVRAFLESEKRTAELWEIVRYANIPSIDTVAFKLFDGYNTIEEAYKDIEEYGVGLVADKLGLRSSATGVMAINIYNRLIEYKQGLLFAETQFTKKTVCGEALNITITGGVYGYANKGEFITSINTKYAGKVNARMLNSVTKETDVLIADGDTSSSKYKKACKMRDEGDDIMVMTSAELVEMLENKYKSAL